MARSNASRRAHPHATLMVWPAIVLAIALGSYAKCAAAEDAIEKRPADVQPPVEAPAEAAKKPAEDLDEARLIRLRLPGSDSAYSDFKNPANRVIEELRHDTPKGKQRPTLVIELVPSEDSSDGKDTKFSVAYEIAKYLTSPDLNDVKTVAYVPKTIKGHGVLIALACEKIVMSPDAELGEATINEDDKLAVRATIVAAYGEIAGAKRTLPEAIVRGMIDRNAEVLKVETDQGIEFKLADQLDDLKKDHTIISQEPVFTKGSLGSVTAAKVRELGILQAGDIEGLARVTRVTADSLRTDQARFGKLKPVMIDVDGPITARKVHQIETMLGHELGRRGVNWIAFSIDSAGGELEQCRQLAQKIADLNGTEVQTVAYVPVDASGGAALVALACEQLVMQPEAHLGGKGAEQIDRETLANLRGPLEPIANRAQRSWSLLAAMIDPQLELFRYENTKTGEVRYFCDEEAREQANADQWRRGARINPPGRQESLRLAAKEAKELGIATSVVDNVEDMRDLYGIKGNIRVAEPNWALELIEALSSPALSVILIVIGFVGIYVELHAPGTGVGAFVAAIAFLLFFWSNFLHGTAEWLEVLLFVGGLFCVLLEVLVLPGLGIFGLGGGAMILASLILATQTFVLPRTESQMVELRHSLTIVTAATLIVVASSIALRRYLPSAPFFNKLLLSPTPEEELVDLDYRESLADYTHLVGEQGFATTNLMPSGKAEFNGQLVDVISEGLPVDRGSSVVVVKARGSRVVVRAVDA